MLVFSYLCCRGYFYPQKPQCASIQPTLKADEYQLSLSLNETETPLWNFRESSNPSNISRCRSCRPGQAKVYLLTLKIFVKDQCLTTAVPELMIGTDISVAL